MSNAWMHEYRVVAADYPLPDAGDLTPTLAEHVVELAQRDLRRRLREGEVPDVVLASPGEGCRVVVEHGGGLPGVVRAWGPEGSPPAYHAVSCLARLEADFYKPEPGATCGAVLLHGARVTEFFVPLWLGPVAARLEALTGVSVRVHPAPEVAEPVVRPGPPVVVKGVLSPAQCEELCAHFDEAESAGILIRSYAAAAPDWARALGHEALVDYAATLGLPATTSVAQVNSYGAGEDFAPHTDSYDAIASTLDRTVSMSLLLGRPGVDWQGGKLRLWPNGVDGEPTYTDAELGDAVFFTARTLHEVTEITEGVRYALVVQAEIDR